MTNNNSAVRARLQQSIGEIRRVIFSPYSSLCGRLFNAMLLLANSGAYTDTIDQENPLDIFKLDSPEVILSDIAKITNTNFTDLAASKLIMAITAYSTDLVYNDEQAFIDFANVAAATEDLRPDVFDPANVLECCLAVLEMAVMDAAFDDDEKTDYAYSDQIKKYWGAMLLSEGFIEPFAPLRGAIMPASEMDVSSQAWGEVRMQADGEARVQIDAMLQVHAQRIYQDVQHLTDASGKSVLSVRELRDIMRSIGIN